MKVERTVEVGSCYRCCPFFKLAGKEMQCGHPYFNDKDLHANMIITQDNSRNTVPMKCPLRSGSLFELKITKLKNY